MSEPFAGLYLHVPFCARVCPYCDFAVRTGDAERRANFVEHLLSEIDLHDPSGWVFDTIYFGGGTPSCLRSTDLGRILERIRSRLTVRPDARVFLEANPEDVSAESVAAWKALGVGTLSLGIQSFDATALEFLGRQHDPSTAERAVGLARDAGFETVSIDLIYGLPDQTEREWESDLDAALALRPHHISCYQLTIHPRTRFALLERRGQLSPLGHDGQADLFRKTHRHLGEAGMGGYEVSQFAASPQHRSRHNRKYWDHTPYLGLGPSSHSFRGRCRWWNLRKTGDWEARVVAGDRPIDATERLEGPDLALEALMTGLRTYDGVDLESLESRWGVELRQANERTLARHEEGGFLTRDGDRLRPTLDGLAIADRLASSFEIRPLGGGDA